MNHRRLLLLLAASAMLTWSVDVAADSWRFPAKIEKQSFSFGNVQAVVTTDARKDQRFPRFQIEVLHEGRMVALIPGAAFEQLFASSDNKLFLGLSNSGLPGTAAIVFTSDGEIRLFVRHQAARFDYCQESVTLQREWYDSRNPEVRFALDAPEGKSGIFLRDCKGQEIELSRAVQQAYGRAAAAR